MFIEQVAELQVKEIYLSVRRNGRLQAKGISLNRFHIKL